MSVVLYLAGMIAVAGLWYWIGWRSGVARVMEDLIEIVRAAREDTDEKT